MGCFGRMTMRKFIRVTADQRTIAAATLSEYRRHANFTQAKTASLLRVDRADLARVERAEAKAPGWIVMHIIERIAPIVERLALAERLKQSTADANTAAYHGDVDGDASL